MFVQLLVFSALASPTPVVSLEESWKASFIKSEVLADQIEQLNQAELNYKQAVAAILPTVTGMGSYQIQDTSNVPSTSGFFQGAQPSVKINVAQPLFRGLREYAGLRSANKKIGAQLHAKYQAQLQIMQDVSTTYFQILMYERDLANYKNELSLYDDRTVEIKKRISIGRSRETELLLLQSQQSSTRAAVKQTAGLLEQLRQTYAFMTGLDPHSVLADAKTIEPVAQLEEYLKKVESRPDLVSNKYKYDSADEGVSIAKGTYLPNADLNFNYYLVRAGLLQNVSWDATASLSWPLFQGGAIDAGLKVAVSQRQQAELALERSMRQAKQDLGGFYAVYLADFEQFKELKDAAEFAKKYYEQQNKDYRLSLVTNVDLQLALSSYQQAVRARDRGEYTVALDLLKVRIQSGDLQAAYVSQ